MTNTKDIMGGARIIRSVTTDLDNIEAQANNTNGPDKYVIRAMTSQISSLFRLETAIDKNRSETTLYIDKLIATIKNLDDKNIKLQRTALILTAVGTVFAILSAIQVVEILRQWFKLW